MGSLVSIPNGSKFGRLTVCCYVPKIGYVCICDCGNKVISRSWSLKTGRHASCGCAPKKLKPDHLAAFKHVYKGYRGAAKRKRLKFELSLEDFSKLLVQQCHYCGGAPKQSIYLPRHSDFRYNGIDRKDNGAGYTKANCVSCCMVCNYAKRTRSYEEFLAWIDRLVAFREKKTNELQYVT